MLLRLIKIGAVKSHTAAKAVAQHFPHSGQVTLRKRGQHGFGGRQVQAIRESAGESTRAEGAGAENQDAIALCYQLTDQAFREVVTSHHPGSREQLFFGLRHLRLLAAVEPVQVSALRAENAQIKDASLKALTAARETSGLAATIVTTDEAAAREFMDSYAGTGVFWNASTRLLDGFKLRRVPETGINVDRVPGPRGPVTFADLYLRQFVVIPACWSSG